MREVPLSCAPNWQKLVGLTQDRRRPMRLFWLAGGFNLVALVLMGAPLAVWR